MNINIVVFNAAASSTKIENTKDLIQTAKEFQFPLEDHSQSLELQNGDLMSIVGLHETTIRRDSYALANMLNNQFAFIVNSRGRREQVIAVFYRTNRFSLMKNPLVDGPCCIYHDRFIGIFLKDNNLGLKILFFSVHLPHKGNVEKTQAKKHLKDAVNLHKDRVNVVIVAGVFNAVPSEFSQTFPKYDEHNFNWVYAITKDILPSIKPEARPQVFDNIIFNENDYLKYIWQPSLERKFANKFDHYPFLFQLVDKENLGQTLREFLDFGTFLKSKVEITKKIISVVDRLMDKESKSKRDEWSTRKNEFMKIIRYPSSQVMKKDAVESFCSKMVDTLHTINHISREEHMKSLEAHEKRLVDIKGKVKGYKRNLKSIAILLRYVEEIKVNKDIQRNSEWLKLTKQRKSMEDDLGSFIEKSKPELTWTLREWRAQRSEMEFLGILPPLNDAEVEKQTCALLTMKDDVSTNLRIFLILLEEDMKVLSKASDPKPSRRHQSDNVKKLLPKCDFPSSYCELLYFHLFDLLTFCLNC